jgi:hypothetical protein
MRGEPPLAAVDRLAGPGAEKTRPWFHRRPGPYSQKSPAPFFVAMLVRPQARRGIVMAQQRHPPGPPMTLGNMRDLAVRNLRAEAERKAIVDAQEIVAIWNAERVVSQLADREPPPVAFLAWDRTAERTGTRRAIPPNHKMNVVRCRRARLGLELIKKEKAPMSATIYFRSLAARCRTSARDCFDHFAREEFHRLAHEFETRAEQLEYSTAPRSQAGWWLTRGDQARGSEGDH